MSRVATAAVAVVAAAVSVVAALLLLFVAAATPCRRPAALPSAHVYNERWCTPPLSNNAC